MLTVNWNLLIILIDIICIRLLNRKYNQWKRWNQTSKNNSCMLDNTYVNYLKHGNEQQAHDPYKIFTKAYKWTHFKAYLKRQYLPSLLSRVLLKGFCAIAFLWDITTVVSVQVCNMITNFRRQQLEANGNPNVKTVIPAAASCWRKAKKLM